MATIFRRDDMKNAAGTPAFYLSYKGLDGRRHRERTDATTPKEAELLLARRLSEQAQAEGRGLTSVEAIKLVTLQSYVDETYLPNIKEQIKAGTYARYLTASKAVCELLGDKPIQHIRPRDIREYRTKRATKDARRKAKVAKKPGKATLNRDRQFLYAVMQMAMQDELIPANPVSATKKLKEPPGRDRWLTKEEVAKLLTIIAAGSSTWLAPIVKLAVLTGMRLSEILNLKRADVQGDTIRLSVTKNGKVRRVRINGPMRQLFEQASAFNESIGSEGAGILVFPNEKGKAYKASSVGHAFKKAVRVAGFDSEGPDKVTFHTLRHTAISWMVQQGVKDREIMETVGHGSKDILDRYAHLAPESVDGPAMALEADFSKVEALMAANEKQFVPQVSQVVGQNVAEVESGVSLSAKAS